MRTLLTSLALLAIFVTPIVAHADVLEDYTITNGVLNHFLGTYDPATMSYSDIAGAPEGTVNGTFQFDKTSGQFTSVDLSYDYMGATTVIDTITATTSNGGFYSAILPDGSFTAGAAYLELTEAGVLCTLASPCPGGNASNFNGGSDVPNIGSASVTVTPEPSSLVLLGTGILGAAGMARRRLRKA